jgi:hypothetical protein
MIALAYLKLASFEIYYCEKNILYFQSCFLKVPKRENFSLAFFAQTKPIWVCDLENKTKKIFFGRLTP